jgi:hypothetical protein
MFSLVRSSSVRLSENPLRRLQEKTYTLEGRSHHRCISMEDIQARVISPLYPKLVRKHKQGLYNQATQHVRCLIMFARAYSTRSTGPRAGTQQVTEYQPYHARQEVMDCKACRSAWSL